MKKSNFVSTGEDLPSPRIPVVNSISLQSLGNIGESKEWAARPPALPPSSFVFEVVGRTMFPHFSVGDHAYVDIEVTDSDVGDGDFVVVQHRMKDYGGIRQVVMGDSAKDKYLTGTNQEIPNSGIMPYADFHLIGIIRAKITMYR